MTENLQSKFNDLKDMLAEHHGEVVQKLDDILESLGVVPTTTLADVVAAINTLGDKIAVTNNRLLSIDSGVNVLSINVETMLQNNSLNAQRILSALALLDPCKPCDTAIDLPVIGVNPVTLNAVHCQRMQLLLDTIRQLLVKFDSLVRAGVQPSVAVIAAAVTSVVQDTFSLADLVPPSISELSYLIVGLITYAAAIFFSVQLPVQEAFDLVHGDLLSVLYTADSASAGRAAYINYIDNAAGLTDVQKQLIKGVAYVGLFNYVYDTQTTIDVDEYDGTICGDGETEQECVTVSSQTVAVSPSNGHSPRQMAIFDDYTLIDTFTWPGGSGTTTPAAIHSGDFGSYRVNYVSGRVRIVYGVNGSQIFIHDINSSADNFTLPTGTDYVMFDDNMTTENLPGSGAFSVEFCTPEQV